ncbi:MAG: hypothetical protein FJ253_05190, partial [Phycisphaerae bacterium]|nr:hypothetical protein [Phycisphaerae bacterium]
MTPRHQIPASNDRDDAGTPCPSPIDLAAWCDGSLEDERSGAIALHLSECARCRVAVGADEATVPQAAASARGAPLV